jgi:WD40 repeat protein
VTIIAEGCKALSASQDKSFRVWDLNTSAYKKQDRLCGHLQGVIDIAVSRDGSRCVSGSMDGTFKIWKCENAEECFTLAGSQNENLKY